MIFLQNSYSISITDSFSDSIATYHASFLSKNKDVSYNYYNENPIYRKLNERYEMTEIDQNGKSSAKSKEEIGFYERFRVPKREAARSFGMGEVIVSDGRISNNEKFTNSKNETVFKRYMFSETNFSNSNDAGTDFKFTTLSNTGSIPDYKRAFINSKCFTLEITEDGMYQVISISLTKDYHPQHRLLKINDGLTEKYTEEAGENSENVNSASKYFLKKGLYIVEIGSDQTINIAPFRDIDDGRFVFILSKKNKSLQEILEGQKYLGFVQGKPIEIDVTNKRGITRDNTSINLEKCIEDAKSHMPVDEDPEIRERKRMDIRSKDNEVSEKYIQKCMTDKAGRMGELDIGIIDYAITPYYDEEKQQIDIFAKSKINFYIDYAFDISKFLKGSKISIKCKESADSPSESTGNEVLKSFYEFTFFGKNICDLSHILSLDSHSWYKFKIN